MTLRDTSTVFAGSIALVPRLPRPRAGSFTYSVGESFDVIT